MTQRASLFAFNPERHRDVRLIPGVDLARPLLTHHAEIGLDEVAAAAADYPLLFLKDGETGRLRLVALFGLAPGQNSYVVDDIWQAVYLPLAVAMAPFRLAGQDRILCIDEANPRVTTETGEALFNHDLTDTPFMENIRGLLGRLDQGCRAADEMIDTLLAMGLAQAVAVTAEFATGPGDEVEGLYSINPRLLELIEPASLLNLHNQGLLAPIYAIIQSLNQLNRVKQLHNLGPGRKISAFRIAMAST